MKRFGIFQLIQGHAQPSVADRPQPLSSRKLGIKLFFEDVDAIDPAALLPVLEGWVRRRTFAGERLVDVVAYDHLQYGPWVMLIGATSLWVFDAKHGQVGVRYLKRRASREGFGVLAERVTPRTALRATFASALTAARHLRLEAGIEFRADAFEVEIADPLLAPNDEDTFERAEPELRAFGREVFDAPRLVHASASDFDGFFRARVEGTRRRRIDELIAELDRLTR